MMQIDNVEIPQPTTAKAQQDVGNRGWFRLPAELISWVMVPLLCPVYGVIIIFSISLLKYMPLMTKVIYVGLTFMFTCIVPLITFMLLKWFGMISDIGLNERKERSIPYIITIVCMLACAYLFYTKGAQIWVVMFFVGGAVTGLVELIVNRWWKISAHAAGVAGLVALLVRMTHVDYIDQSLMWWIIGAILLSGLVCSCRLYLNRHTLMQVFAGSVCGYACVYLCMLV